MSKSSDINMSQPQKTAILNRIVEQTNHGLNSKEIVTNMPNVTKAQLIRLIKDLAWQDYKIREV